jgi:hypothetical protein
MSSTCQPLRRALRLHRPVVEQQFVHQRIDAHAEVGRDIAGRRYRATVLARSPP